MSPSVQIRVVKRKSGNRYVVRYRVGGRGFPLIHAGSFRSQKEARTRRDFIAGELAAGRNPREALAAVMDTRPERDLEQWAAAYQQSRIDVGEETTKNVRSHVIRILATFGPRNPLTITWTEVQEWVALQAVDLKPSSLRRYFSTLRLILDFAGVDPNPARDPRVKLPSVETVVPQPPSGAQVAAILSAVPSRWRLPLRVLEQTGMRVGELRDLEWRDVDAPESRFRVRSGKTAAARRWIRVPEWVLAEVLDETPPDDRMGERRVFSGFTPDVAKNAMARACKALSMPHFHPHDLRHRYISVKLREGVPVPDVSAQVGHSRKSITLDTYAHVLVEEDE